MKDNLFARTLSHLGLKAHVQSSAISPRDFRQLQIDKEPHVLVDVRTVEEYRQGHIPGSKNIDVDSLARKAQKELPDQNLLIIIYCRSGARATIATRLLQSMGYANVRNLGGILGWPYDIIIDEGI